MKRHQRIVATLLVTASLTAPGLAWAGAGETAPDKPALPVTEPAAPLSTKVSQAEAITTVKKFFEIPATLGEPNVGFSQSKDYAVWRLEWHTADKQAPQMSISVEVDANTGKVRSFGRWQEGDSSAALAYTKSEALKLAEAWLDKLGADLKATLRYRDLNDYYYYGGTNATYNFHWDRLEQGYPVGGQGIDIAINARSGELERFSTSWTEGGTITYTLPKSVITKAQAEEVYRTQLPMVLQYQRFNKPGTDDYRWLLVYRPVTGFAPLISTDGKLVDGSNNEMDLTKYKDLPVVPVPIAPYKKPEKPLTRDEALKLAKDVTGRTGEPNWSNYSEYGDKVKQRVWEFSWNGPAEEKGLDQNTNVRIDAEAGIVTSMYSWKQGAYEPLKEGEEPKMTLEEARQTALGLMLRFRPDLAGAAQLMPSDQDRMLEMKLGGRPGLYSIRFVHLKNGIPNSDGGSNFEIDARTGDLMSFSSYDLRIDKDEFPEPEGVIEPAKALDVLLQQQPLELVWTTIYSPYMPGRELKEPEAPKTMLVWAPTQSAMVGIDAKLGVPLDGSGRDLIEAAKRPVDIEGHYAQREIELLWTRGVFELKDGKFNPSDSITIDELARWLVLAKGMQPYPMYDFMGAFAGSAAPAAKVIEQSANVAYYGAALRSGIFQPEDFSADFDLNAKATREQFALWAARAMGYGSIAKMPNRIANSFADGSEIDAKYVNAVGILEGLGVIKGSGAGTFMPKRLITRAEAAKMLFAITAETRR